MNIVKLQTGAQEQGCFKQNLASNQLFAQINFEESREILCISINLTNENIMNMH